MSRSTEAARDPARLAAREAARDRDLSSSSRSSLEARFDFDPNPVTMFSNSDLASEIQEPVGDGLRESVSSICDWASENPI